MRDLTREQEKRRKALEKRLCKVLEDMASLGLELGAESVNIYVEPESGFHVKDTGHPNYDVENQGAAGEQAPLLFSLFPHPRNATLDAGGW